jgi:pyridoxamine---pyruvate transaminase
MKNVKISEPTFSFTAGPVDAYPAVLRGLSTPMARHDDVYFQDFYEQTSKKLQQAMRTKHMPVILHAQTALGLEGAAASMLGPNDVLLNLASGPYGKGYKSYAKRYAREIIEIEVPDDSAIDPARVADAFEKRPDIKVVSVVHLETPSGTINPVADIGHIAHEHGALTIVDAATSWAGMDINPDSSNTDMFITGPHKSLGGVPGLTLLGVSPEAWAHMEKNPNAPRGSILSILDWRHAWRSTERYPILPSIAEINGLQAALVNYLNEGPEVVWARHARATRIFRTGLYAMGLKIWPKSEAIASDGVIAVTLPEGISPTLLSEAARRLYGVNFSHSQGDTADKVIIVALLGRVAQPMYAVTALAALGGSLNALGDRADTGAGVNAALSMINADT